MKKPLKQLVKDYLEKIDYDNWEDGKYHGKVDVEVNDLMNIIKNDSKEVKKKDGTQ